MSWNTGVPLRNALITKHLSGDICPLNHFEAALCGGKKIN